MNRLNDSWLSGVQLLLVDFVNRLLHPLGRGIGISCWSSVRINGTRFDGPSIHFWEKFKWDETAEKHAYHDQNSGVQSCDDGRFVAQAPGNRRAIILIHHRLHQRDGPFIEPVESFQRETERREEPT